MGRLRPAISWGCHRGNGGVGSLDFPSNFHRFHTLRILTAQKWRHFENLKTPVQKRGSKPSIGGSLGILRVATFFNRFLSINRSWTRGTTDRVVPQVPVRHESLESPKPSAAAGFQGSSLPKVSEFWERFCAGIKKRGIKVDANILGDFFFRFHSCFDFHP